MAMPFDYTHACLGRPFAAVGPVIDATSPGAAIRQILDFLSRSARFSGGVPDTSFFPFSAICKLRITFPSVTGGGTGFYVAPDLILTCGHNIFHATFGRASAITVRPGQQDASTWLDSFPVTPDMWTAHPRWDSSGASDSAFDLAVIRVHPSAPGMDHFELINYSPAADEPIAVCGYSGEDVDSQRQHLDIDIVRRLTPDFEMVEYNLQTRRGGSGSPIFAHYPSHEAGSFDPSAIPVMGVHTRGADGQHNRGVLLTPDKIDWINGRGISSVSSFSLGPAPARKALGGLPLVHRSHLDVGGLPLQPPGRTVRPARAMSSPRTLERSWIVIDQSDAGPLGVPRRTFGHPTHDLSGKTTLSVRVPNMPERGTVRWNVPDDAHKARVAFETGGATAHSASGTSVTLRALAGGPAAVDCMVKDSGGATVESNKYWLSVPQFVIVSVHPTTDAFFDGIGMGAHRADIYSEAASTLRHLYRNVNVRFVFPGDALPAHLGVASNPDFPGGIEALPSVQYAEVIGADTVTNPETGAAYGATQHGQAHPPGFMPGTMSGHALARGLIHHFADTRPEIGHVQAAATAGALSAADAALAATMYGRLMGENLGHEVGHYLANSIVAHTGGDLMQSGGGRTTRERTGMTVQTTAPLLTDHGRATVNELPGDVLRTFEEFLPVNPPIDLAGVRTRGRVGSFALGQQSGWVNRPVGRALSGETIHLPGATVLSGWEARAFIFALETAFRGALAANPATMLYAPFVSVDTILNACDTHGVTLALGVGLTVAVQGGGAGSFGIVFGPGRQIGFYGSGAGVIGWIWSAGVSAQITLIDGPPQLMDGRGSMAGVSISTIGWFSADLVDAPIAAHMVHDGSGNHIGYSFEFGLSVGVPVLSLIELYGQRTETVMTFGRRRAARSLTAGQPVPGFESAVQAAMAEGATRAEAEAFLAPFFA